MYDCLHTVEADHAAADLHRQRHPRGGDWSGNGTAVKKDTTAQRKQPKTVKQLNKGAKPPNAIKFTSGKRSTEKSKGAKNTSKRIDKRLKMCGTSLV